MPKLIFVTREGTRHIVEASADGSLMRAAINANVPGIHAVCGGSCSCASCHVYVDASWTRTVGRATPIEESMLEFSTQRRPTSRLSCQIRLSDALDGLIVHVPDSQD